MYISEEQGLLSFSCIYKPGKADAFFNADNAVISSVAVGAYVADLLHFESGEESDAIAWNDSKEEMQKYGEYSSPYFCVLFFTNHYLKKGTS